MSDNKSVAAEIADGETGGSAAKLLLICSAASMAVAAIVYACTLAGYVFPGESAHLFTQWLGMDALDAPSHPLWGRLVRLVCGGAFSAVRMNAISMVCGVLGAGMVCWLTGFFVWAAIGNEEAQRHSRGASAAAGLTAAFAFVFSTAVWQSSTHLEYRMFDICYALALFLPLAAAMFRPALLPFAAMLTAFGAGAGLLENAIFLPLLPFYLFVTVVATVKLGKKFYLPTALFLVFALIGYIVFSRSVAGGYLLLPEAETGGCKTAGDVLVRLMRETLREVRAWFARPGWLYVQILAVMPFVACMFAAVRGLNNERKWSQYFFHLGMTLAAIIAIATPLSPDGVMRQFGVSPVATTVMVAMVCGYLAAYWYLTARIELPGVEYDALPAETTFGRRLAPVAGGIFAIALALSALVNAFDCAKGRGEFADLCAKEILDGMGERSWLVTDGMLDDHLRVAAAARGKELNLICLQRDMDDAYLKEFANLIRKKELKAGGANLALSIQLGVLPFLQDWLAGDPDVWMKAAVFGVPDLWHLAQCAPVPQHLFFSGVKDLKLLDGKKLKANFDDFWKRIGPALETDGLKGSRSIIEAKDPVAALRLQLRRHVGFAANNLAVVLQDLGMDSEAFELYELVLKTIDCDNICALFNEFEMARAGVKEAFAKKKEIETQLKQIVDDPKRRYILWSLSRYYGYIRSPEIFARMGYAWARSGQTGNAIAQVQRAIDFVPEENRTGLLNMMAAIYASGRQSEKSRDVYNTVLEKDSANHDALIGLTRLSLQEGDMQGAKDYLQRAVEAAPNKETGGINRALLHFMNNDLAGARMALQKVTDLQPKSLQAWALLAGVLLQKHDTEKTPAAKAKALEELESVILPKMETIADSPRDYHVQMTRAQVFLRKGPDFRKKARDALVTAAAARPDATAVGDMVLNLDIALDDAENAQKHARQILRTDRHHRLANYVMGSLRLKDGDYLNAETFLRTAVATDAPAAAALNDLAETLRRLQRFDEAEREARRAVQVAPNLYVAWETLGASLLDQNKNLDEAETCVKKAITIAKEQDGLEDVRMQISLARVQLAKGDKARARSTLRAVRSKSGELSKYDRSELEKLTKLAAGK